MVTGRPAMIVEELEKVSALQWAAALSGPAAAVRSVGQDHLAHRIDPVAIEEHVLGAAQANAFGAETRAPSGIARRSALARTVIRRMCPPSHQLGEITGELRLDRGHFTRMTWPVAPSMVIDIACLDACAPMRTSAFA